MRKANATKMAGIGALLVLLAATAGVNAEHVEPTAIDPEDNNNPTCADFGDWTESKIEDPESGTHSDGTLNVTLVVGQDEDGEPSEFDWTSNMGVSDVVVKDGSHGHHLYVYDPAAMADTGLTAGEHDKKEDKFGAISHISFCYTVDDEQPPNGDETPPSNGDETPPPNGNETPPPADVECPPGTLSATANQDSSISVSAMDLDQDAALMRSDGGDFSQVASLDGGNNTYEDTHTEVGVTYTYQLVIDGKVCDLIEVTAIPVFPGLMGAALATGLGVLGYMGLRRRSG